MANGALAVPEAALPAERVSTGGRHRIPKDILADGTAQWIHYGTIATDFAQTKTRLAQSLGDDGCDQQFRQLFQSVQTTSICVCGPLLEEATSTEQLPLTAAGADECRRRRRRQHATAVRFLHLLEVPLEQFTLERIADHHTKCILC